MNNQEHTYIEEYLKGELDWELLVDVVGEDMARGVRISENYLRESETLGDRMQEVAHNIKNNGVVAQAMKESFGINRKGKRS